MHFQSILFPETDDKRAFNPEAPACFPDLFLYQVVDAIVNEKDAYDLKPFFYTPLKDLNSITYRHEIFKDLENSKVFKYIGEFAANMHAWRKYCNQTSRIEYKYHKEGFFLDEVMMYCQAVNSLAMNLSGVVLNAAGLLAFREYITEYVTSNFFKTLWAEARELTALLSSVRYCILVSDLRVQVFEHKPEPDFSAEIEETFSKFRQGAVKDYRVGFSHLLDINHVEAKILNGVALLFPAIFQKLDEFYIKNVHFSDQTITIFDREIQFYLAYLGYMKKIEALGLKFCYPVVSDQDKEVYNYEGFDLALAWRMINTKADIVTNDFYLREKERILVVSGPNQGGKTTFARTFGQLHYLARLGCPVPGCKARLFFYDQLFTHFEKEENIQLLRGKLEDELIRMNDIIEQASGNSIIIINEIFSSTTIDDAIFLDKKIMEKIVAKDLLCVWVSFIDELACFSEQTVSMVSTVATEDPDIRTFKIVRKPANGLAYALSIARKYGLTYNDLKMRLRHEG